MGIILFVVFGFIVGLLARAIMPGTQKMGFVSTALLGIAGSFIGGFLAALVTSFTEFVRLLTSEQYDGLLLPHAPSVSRAPARRAITTSGFMPATP